MGKFLEIDMDVLKQEELNWYLGWMFGDGYVHAAKRPIVYLGLQSRDRDVLYASRFAGFSVGVVSYDLRMNRKYGYAMEILENNKKLKEKMEEVSSCLFCGVEMLKY